MGFCEEGSKSSLTSRVVEDEDRKGDGKQFFSSQSLALIHGCSSLTRALGWGWGR